MIRHIVLIQFPKSCPANTVASIYSQIEKPKSVVREMKTSMSAQTLPSCRWGRASRMRSRLISTMSQHRDGYWEHPGHIAVAKQLVPLLDKGSEDVLIFQFPFETH